MRFVTGKLQLLRSSIHKCKIFSIFFISVPLLAQIFVDCIFFLTFKWSITRSFNLKSVGTVVGRRPSILATSTCFYSTSIRFLWCPTLSPYTKFSLFQQRIWNSLRCSFLHPFLGKLARSMRVWFECNRFQLHKFILLVTDYKLCLSYSRTCIYTYIQCIQIYIIVRVFISKVGFIISTYYYNGLVQ